MAILMMIGIKWLTCYELLVIAMLLMIVIKWLACYEPLFMAMLMMIGTNGSHAMRN